MKCETDAKQSKARHFFEKDIKKGPKIHCLALNLYTGPPNCITWASWASWICQCIKLGKVKELKVPFSLLIFYYWS